jgi:hypothetical protein
MGLAQNSSLLLTYLYPTWGPYLLLSKMPTNPTYWVKLIFAQQLLPCLWAFVLLLFSFKHPLFIFEYPSFSFEYSPSIFFYFCLSFVLDFRMSSPIHLFSLVVYSCHLLQVHVMCKWLYVVCHFFHKATIQLYFNHLLFVNLVCNNWIHIFLLSL